MLEQSKLVIEWLAADGKKGAGECRDCQGEGNYDDAPDGSCGEHMIPCPTCAGYRELAGLCIHEKWTDTFRERRCDICGARLGSNPTIDLSTAMKGDTLLLFHLLEKAGKLEEFTHEVARNPYKLLGIKPDGRAWWQHLAETMRHGELALSAVVAWINTNKGESNG